MGMKTTANTSKRNARRLALESVAFGVDSRVEVYDHPDPRTALPRFCGYLPDETGRKFVQLAREHADFPAPGVRPALAKCA